MAVPLVISLAKGVLPTPTSIAAKLKSILITPPAIGRRHREPAWGGLGLQPTRGIAILVLYMLVINLLLSVVDYRTVQPNFRYATKEKEVMMEVGLRAGLLSFANMALVIFLAGRNTFMCWLTDWSRSTYLLIHRWIAYVSIIQAAIHCLVYLHHYVSRNMCKFERNIHRARLLTLLLDKMHVVMPFFIWVSKYGVT